MLFIHGGSFTNGAGSESTFNGTRFVNIGENIVYISINYRLGPLGFFPSDELYDEDSNWPSNGGMNGIWDQISVIHSIHTYLFSTLYMPHHRQFYKYRCALNSTPKNDGYIHIYEQAIKWVSQRISYFGGDGNDITIFGGMCVRFCFEY